MNKKSRLICMILIFSTGILILILFFVKDVFQNKIFSLMPQSDIEFITKTAEHWRDMETVIKGGPPVEEVKKVVNILEKIDIDKEGIILLLGEPGQKTIGDQAESWNYFLADSRLLVITFDKKGKCVHISGTDIGQ